MIKKSYMTTILALLLWSTLPVGAKEAITKKGKVNPQSDEIDSYESKALKVELLVEKSEKQAISQLTKLIRKYKNSPLEADMQMRLAELYVRRSKTVLFFELNKDGILSKHTKT